MLSVPWNFVIPAVSTFIPEQTYKSVYLEFDPDILKCLLIFQARRAEVSSFFQAKTYLYCIEEAQKGSLIPAQLYCLYIHLN